MLIIKRIFNIGIPIGMPPEEAKYIGMCNAGVFFFTAGGAIMLFRRETTRWMVLAAGGCVACYYIALGLSRSFPPFYRLSDFELSVLNTSIEITFVILIVIWDQGV